MKKRLIISTIILVLIFVTIILVNLNKDSIGIGCSEEGETIGIGEKCCKQLEQLKIYNNESCEYFIKSQWVCSNCGNNQCEEWENNCNCPEDC